MKRGQNVFWLTTHSSDPFVRGAGNCGGGRGFKPVDLSKSAGEELFEHAEVAAIDLFGQVERGR